jgi:Ca-activated chloride channel homolog
MKMGDVLMSAYAIRNSVLLLLVALISACGTAPVAPQSEAEVGEAAAATTTLPQATPTAAPSPTESPTTTPTAEPTSTPAPTPTPRPEEALEAQWFVDSDGNAIPDFLEVELGYDPLNDDCSSEECGPGGAGADLLSKERNLLLMLDSSGSMAGQVGGETKIDVAKAALIRYVDAISDFYQLGFLVYGHKGNNTPEGKAESCVGIDILSEIGTLDRATIPVVVEQFQPTGWTPIAAALRQAGTAFAGKEGQHNEIIMVSDGIETCDGDPVAVAQELHEQEIKVKINIVGFDVAEGSADAQQLKRIAEVTGGTYQSARNRAELDSYFQQQGQALSATFDSMICEVRNSFHNNLCDQTMINKAIARISELRSAAMREGRRDQAAAYDLIANQIRATFAERQEVRDEATERKAQLETQYFELVEQIRRAYNRDQ